jgi:DNA-binding NarL/FixJ family response regulator
MNYSTQLRDSGAGSAAQSGVMAEDGRTSAAKGRTAAHYEKMTSPLVGQQGYAGDKSPLMTEYSVLFITADAARAVKLEGLLSEDDTVDLKCTRVDALFDGLRAIQDRQFDLVLSELFLPDGQGLATLRHLQQHAPKTPVILLCHAQDRDTAVTAVRKGAHDFFCYEDLDAANFQRSVMGALNSAPGTANSTKEAERRTNARFDCHLAVSYQTLEKPFLSGQGSSETLNISSKGVLFKADEALEPGQLVQVSVDWPARLEKQIPLKLVAEGRIVRNIKGVAAMTIEKYEFRTRRASTQPSAQATTQNKSAASADGKTTTSRSTEAAKANSSRPGTAAGGSTRGI